MCFFGRTTHGLFTLDGSDAASKGEGVNPADAAAHLPRDHGVAAAQMFLEKFDGQRKPLGERAPQLAAAATRPELI
jgi:hypothetical protein